MGRKAGVRKPPPTMTVRFCTECGRNDRYHPFQGKAHYFNGARCNGLVVPITYHLAPASS